jgi:twitching motility protein PilT
MAPRDLVALLKAAPWKTDAEIDAFAAAAGELAASDVAKALDMVASRGGEASLQPTRSRAFLKLAERVPDKSLFGAYVRALRSPDPHLRATLVQLLPQVNNVAEHPTLVAVLRTADEAVRRAAAGVLAQIGGRTAFELLADMVREAGFPGRAEAMDVLVAVAPQHAAGALGSVLEVGTPAEKLKAIDHLLDPRCAGKDPTAVAAALARAVDDPQEPVAVRALTALSAVAPEETFLEAAGAALTSPSLTVTRAAVDGLKSYPSPRAVGLLHGKLREGPSVIRMAAIDALETIGTVEALAPLAEALGNAQLSVRTRAAEALSRLSLAGKVDLARTIIWLLRSRDVNVRRMAVEVAHSVRDPAGELWPKLLAHLRDEDWWVRERVMDALVDMAGNTLVRYMVGYLQDPSELVRRWGVEALIRLRAPEALGALVRTLGSDPDWWVRERAVEAVGALNDARAVPHLVDAMLRDPLLRVACLQALAEMEAHEAAPQVASLVGSDDPDVQLAALHCLQVFDDSAQASAVEPLLNDANAQVRAAARALVDRWRAAEREASSRVEQPSAVLDQLLVAVAKTDGDDLILAPGRQPFVKRFGKAVPLARAVFSAERVRSLLVPHLSAKQLADLDARQEVDFSYRVESGGLRFRVNVFNQHGGVGAVFRIIKDVIPDIATLGLPPTVKDLADLPHGLVLVGGPTGSGKSTTLAALIDHVNRTSKRHIITLEDPIEVVHSRKMSLVNQREVGTHTASFGQALRSTLREDPDVILVGEMRDLPTISFAVTAAETGHLVFGTIHTVSAAGTVDRLINAFPAAQQDHVRSLLAGSLRAVVCQYLHRRRDGPGRCLSVEVMLNSDAIANLIRKGKAFQIPSVISTSREAGMQLMDAELMRLVREGKISPEDAYAKAASKKEFERLVPPEPRPAPEARPA